MGHSHGLAGVQNSRGGKEGFFKKTNTQPSSDSHHNQTLVPRYAHTKPVRESSGRFTQGAPSWRRPRHPAVGEAASVAPHAQDAARPGKGTSY